MSGTGFSQKSAGSGRLASCDDFQALIPSYREGTLAPGRRMLLEDHAHQCVVCRKVLFGETEAPPKVIEMPARRMTRARWMAIAASVTVALIAGRWAYEQFAPAPAGSRATVQLADGGVYRLEKGMLQPVSAGMELRDGEILRTCRGFARGRETRWTSRWSKSENVRNSGCPPLGGI